MRLLEIPSLRFVEYVDELQIPSYGILSHRWEDEEVSYHEMVSGKVANGAGYNKILGFSKLCASDGLSYAWIDTCCIDKTSSAELSEAINSMYRWYQNTTRCYAFLSDIDAQTNVASSRWFDRGWTLQELIAPDEVLFYNKDWVHLGSKQTLCFEISQITRIPENVLHGDDLENYSIAQRMSWAARRETTRVEDRAYSLMGLFKVNMPMLYGEGEKAFIRLQEEIMKYSSDHSIFAWPGILSNYQKAELYDVTDRRLEGLLATSPAAFEFCDAVEWQQNLNGPKQSFSVTNIGLSIKMLLRPVSIDVYEARLNCFIASEDDRKFISIFLRQTDEDDQYLRHELRGSLTTIWTRAGDVSSYTNVNIVQGYHASMSQVCSPWVILGESPLYPSGAKHLPVTVPKESVVYSNRMFRIAPGGYEHVASLNTRGGYRKSGTALLRFGFDFHFNPHLHFCITKAKESNVRASSAQAIQCKRAEWNRALGREVLVLRGTDDLGHGWKFEGHHRKGLLVWLFSFNTVISIHKRPVLDTTTWVIDIVPADVSNPHILSYDTKTSKPSDTASPLGSALETLRDEDECVICRKFLDTPIGTSCLHVFCQPCVRWVDVSITHAKLDQTSQGTAQEISRRILCPICGSATYGGLSQDHDKHLQHEYLGLWRHQRWKSRDTGALSKFPVLEPLTLVIGNTHKIDPSRNYHQGRANRHDWTFFVRPSRPECVASVRIILHQTFRESEVELTKPPYELRRFGWGTFEIVTIVTLKQQYSFQHEAAVLDNEQRSQLRTSWTLNFAADVDQGWIKVIIRRTKSTLAAHDEDLLAQFTRLRALRAATEILEPTSRYTNPNPSPA